ncbi:hypothetical protein F5148DRAFT_1235691 [Russula earlei]|uniref:Uncharacterized protein n=1 Tax=Russula earlei TaxID=71964 RepID=A0ACC0TXE8_9AGAM|nr:hypothetical protein F5148DRAFT_1235691 [Russula earlei]
MQMTLSLQHDVRLHSTPSHSASSLEPPSTPGSATGSIQPKSERRASLAVLDSAKFRLSHDFARLVRSSSSVSSKSTHTGRTASTHGSRALASDYENEPHTGLSHHRVDLDHHDMPTLFADPPPESLSRRAKFYGFLSRSSSRSRSRSKGDTRPSDSGSNESPDLMNATTTTTASTSGTSDSHLAAIPASRHRSPTRPLSDNTTTTGETVTPKNLHSRASRASRVPHHAQSLSPHLINDSGIGVNDPLITYDPRMPPPLVAASASARSTSAKDKRRSKQLFGLPVAPWSRPTTPKDEDTSVPPHAPPGRPSKVSKIENWFKIGLASSATPSPRPIIAAPQPRRPMAPPIPADRVNVGMRPHSTPPRIHASREVESSDSERDGRCSPLFGLGKQRERTHDHQQVNSGKPFVASREGPNASKDINGALLPSSEFEHGGSVTVRRSMSHRGHRLVQPSHADANGQPHSHAYRSRGHAHINSPGQDARSHRRTHTRSRSHAHPVRSHTHPQPSNDHGAGSPHAALQSPLLQSVTGVSAASQSTTGTAATNTTTGAPVTSGSGSWGRTARTADWVRGAGVHPPFAFESAASSTASARSDIRERERDRDRERSRRHVVQEQIPTPPVRIAGSGAGRWEQREVELGLGLTWAPTTIRVREWTPGVNGAGAGTGDTNGSKDGDARARAQSREREMEKRVMEREGERRTRERLAEYELGYGRSRSRKDREVTGRFRDVLGAEGFEAFKKYVRRFDADLIPLEGPSGLLGRVECLLDKAPGRHIGVCEKRELLDDLVRIVRENEW